MRFANRLFTISFIATLWIAFMGWRGWSEMWVGVVVFGVGMLATGIMMMGVETGDDLH